MDIIDACNYLIARARDGFYDQDEDEMDDRKFLDAQDVLVEFLRNHGVLTHNLEKNIV